MKNYFNSILGVVMIFSLFIFGCQNNTPKPEDIQGEVEEIVNNIVEEPVVANEDLAMDVKARNIFANTTVILSGSMMFAFSEMFQGQTGAFKEAFTKLSAGEVNVKDIDEQIKALPAELVGGLDAMKFQLDSAYNELESSNQAIYTKMFDREIMKEGVEIAEKYELPNGFRPLTQNLTQEEIKRYILKVVAAGEDAQTSEEPVLKMYKEIFDWLQKASMELTQDAEISAYMEQMSKKE